MILDEIVLHNFGLYAERQTVVLTPPSSSQPVILFGGLNGHGKTTLLDALQLCLYGPFARTSNRHGLSYQDYLLQSLHRNSRTREAAVEVSFRHTVDGDESRYRLHRSWQKGKNGCKEHFEVLRNRRLDTTLAENWINQVEDLIPPNIANLFFFDGEQIESYAAPETSIQLIGTAIRNLLGLDVVERLEQDLQIYSRRKRMKEQNNPLREGIQKTETRLKDLSTQLADWKQKQAALKVTDIDPACKEFARVETEYRRLGGDLYEQRMEIDREKAEAERVSEEAATRLRTFAAGDLPLLLVRGLLENVNARDQEEVTSRQAREIADVLEGRDWTTLEKLRSNRVDNTIIKAITAYLEKDRDRRRRLGERQTMLNLLPATRNDLQGLLHGGLDQLAQDIGLEFEKRVELENRTEAIHLRHASIPEDDAISEIITKRDALREEIALLEAKHSAMGEEVSRLHREIEHSKQHLARLLDEDARMEGQHHDRTRILRHVSRVIVTLNVFRKRVIEKHLRRIEKLVLDCYHQLLRKSSLVSRLEIDPENFALELYGNDSKVLNPDRLSAGERQLLAIALLWGLAKASGRPLPTAIDTPLGRLDADHRMHLIERYFPYASHQVLLFSTDEEITGRYLRKLRPFIGRNYRLDYDDATGRTRIVEGYFNDLEIKNSDR